jgi:hypothetical protein
MKDLKNIKIFNEHQENLNSELPNRTSSSISDDSGSKKLYLLTFIWEDGDIMGKIIIKDKDKKSIVSSVDKLMGKDYYLNYTKDREFNNNYGKYFDVVNWRWVNYEIETIDVL